MADSVSVLRPNATIAPSSQHLTAVHVETSDDSDTTFGRLDPSISKTKLRVGFTTFAASLVTGVRPRIRVRGNSLSSGAEMRGHFLSGGLVVGKRWTIKPVPTAITTITLPTELAKADGSKWTQADVDNLEIEVTLDFASAGNLDVMEVYADEYHNLAPTVTVTAPPDEDINVAGVQIVSTSTPTIQWVYDDPEGDLQERFRAKVFSQAQYTASGFSPATTTPTHTSGEVLSATQQWTTPHLENGWWRVYVEAADAGSGGRYSALSFTEFQLAASVASAPDPPALASSVDSTLVAVVLSVTPQGVNPTEFIGVERLDNGIWTAVRGAEKVDMGGATTRQVLDHEPTLGTVLSYRARAGVAVSAGDLWSAWSATVTATVTTDAWHLKDPLSPNRVARIVPIENVPVYDTEMPQAIFHPLGRAAPVVLSDVVRLARFPLTIMTETDAERDSFLLLRARPTPLLLMDPRGKNWYVRIGQTLTESSLVSDLRSDPLRRFSFELQEVAKP